MPSNSENDARRAAIDTLLASTSNRATRRHVGEMIDTCVKLADGDFDSGQLKLLNHALKEMRYSYGVFNKYRVPRKVAIYGSARTPEDHPDYLAAREFGQRIAEREWMSITGAGDGIMKAGHEGPTRESSFGLRIRLPFETTANEVIEGDPKLINYRYFFTRKLMFMSHADAVAVFPGGFGTQDELFEALTLIQTGKTNPIPLVLVEGEGGVYWKHWNTYVRRNLLDNGWLSPDDTSLYHIAKTPDEAVEHILQFYRVYHSCRYVGDDLVLRIKRPLSDAHLERLNDEFGDLVLTGAIEQGAARSAEVDHLDLPRLHFHHWRRAYGRLRLFIDAVNNCDDEGGGA